MKYLFVVLLAVLCCLPGKAQQKKYKAYFVADAHLDTQWNWDLQTTISEYVLNTLEQNLFLLQRFPNYVFNFEGGIKYAWMKEYYPEKYELMKEYIRQGRWHIAGSSWEANDVIVPSPESFLRNVLLGQTFYEDEFGVQSRDIFLPDCFGFSWTLPSLAAHCGLIGFSTQKFQWRYNNFHDYGKYPFPIGLWQGVDSARIMLVGNGYSYSAEWGDDLSRSDYIRGLAQQSPTNATYHYYGTGDIGGAPTYASVKAVEESRKSDGDIEVISAGSDQLYKDYLPFEDHPELPVYDGELLMDVHGTGCYTSQAAMKFYNRQNEKLGDAAERAAVVANWMGDTYPALALTEAWKRFIFHQFHDDLTGTSIPRAYEFSWNDELLSLKQFSSVLTTAAGNVADLLDTRTKGIPVVIFNPVAQPVADVVEVELPFTKAPQGVTVFDPQGKEVPAQLVGYRDGKAKVLISADLPALAYGVYEVRGNGKKRMGNWPVNTRAIENSIYKVTLDNNGDITSIWDKRVQKELVKEGKVIRLALFSSNPSYEWPAWEIRKEVIDQVPQSITGEVKISVVENGALRSALCVEKRHGESVFKQYIRLNEGAQKDRIDFYNEIDWHTPHALLKAEFPLNVTNELATYDMGLGSVQRGNNRNNAYEVYAQYWADLTDRKGDYGVSVLNDCKYGWDKPDDHTLRLTLLHAPETKVVFAYQNRQDMGYHTFTYSLLGHRGGFREAGTVLKAEILNQRMKAFSVDRHAGTLGKEFTFLEVNNPDVLVKALKKAEKSDEYIIRVFETDGRKEQQVEIGFAGRIIGAEEVNGVEKTIGKAVVKDNKLCFSIRPYSLKTFKVKLQPADRRVLAVAQQEIPLEYDLKCFSWNEFRKYHNFDGAGHTYAAELLPDTIACGDIEFTLGPKEAKNGMRCDGQTVRLPEGCNRLYLLAASTFGDNRAVFRIGEQDCELTVPYYSGFAGQWGHTGHTEGFLREAEIAYIGTHRHTWKGNKDLPYEFTYMYKFGLDIPKGATTLVLPKNKRIVIFAVTAATEKYFEAKPVSELFGTAVKENPDHSVVFTTENLLRKGKVVGKSGQANDNEKPENMFDGQEDTKWCDMNYAPHYVAVDLGETKEIHGWRVVSAEREAGRPFITRDYCLQGTNDLTAEWETIDGVDYNPENETVRDLASPVKYRYVRLYITYPVRDGGHGARIYEWEVY